jgi:protein-tyrosine phosphatase
MFGFFKRKKNDPIILQNFDAIAVDMHSHVLPGIDDGAATVEDSVFLIRQMMQAGIKKVIASPHIMQDYYRNTPETVNAALAVLRDELKRQNIDIPVEAAAEYYFDEYFIDLVEKGELLSFGSDKYILMEFSFINKPPVFIPTLGKLIDMGYKPILAHPERYLYLKLDELKNMKHWGFHLQINTISLTGYYGKESKKMAEDLIDEGLVDFIGTDMHHPRHAEALLASINTPYVQKLVSGYPLKNSLLL